MNIKQYFIGMVEEDPEYYEIGGQYRKSLSTWLSYASEEHLFDSKYPGNDDYNEAREGQLMTQFEAFHKEMDSGDDSPTGRMAQALIGINKRKPEDWWVVGK